MFPQDSGVHVTNRIHLLPCILTYFEFLVSFPLLIPFRVGPTSTQFLTLEVFLALVVSFLYRPVISRGTHRTITAIGRRYSLHFVQ